MITIIYNVSNPCTIVIITTLMIHHPSLKIKTSSLQHAIDLVFFQQNLRKLYIYESNIHLLSIKWKKIYCVLQQLLHDLPTHHIWSSDSLEEILPFYLQTLSVNTITLQVNILSLHVTDLWKLYKCHINIFAGNSTLRCLSFRNSSNSHF